MQVVEEASESNSDSEHSSKLSVLLNIDGRMMGGLYQGVTFSDGIPDREELNNVLRPFNLHGDESIAVALMHLEEGSDPQEARFRDFEISRNFPGCERYEDYKMGMKKWMLEELALPLDLFKETARRWIWKNAGPENYGIEAAEYKAALLMQWNDEIRAIHFDEVRSGSVPAFCEAAVEQLTRAFQREPMNGPLSLTLVFLEEGKQELFVHRNVLKSSVLDESVLKSSKRIEAGQEGEELARDFEGCATDPIERDLLIRWFLKHPAKE